MSLDKIRDLLELMREHDLVEMEVEEEGTSIRLKKAGALPPPVPMPPAFPGPSPMATVSVPAGGAEEIDPSLTPIKSPIVGTFYRAPAPDADPFVSEGGTVRKDTVVCIIEAMKIMNEVQAGVNGTIERILVENGEPVEFGQPLFLVRT